MYNSSEHPIKWLALNENQILLTRQSKLKYVQASRSKVGVNASANRLFKIIYLVVSIGVILTFKVVFTPLEYFPNMPPLSS